MTGAPLSPLAACRVGGWRGGSLAVGPGAFVPPVSRSVAPPQCSWSGLLRFQPPPPRTVHAVLPHTAHRRRSPPAFGFPRQSRKGLGSTTIPDKVISPSWFGDWKVTTDQPNARERRWRLLMNSASRIRA